MMNDSLPILPSQFSSLPEIRSRGAIYVDKTQQLCHMMKRAPRVSLINRPPGFGKSVMLSTLRELYLGNKELFIGTWAYDNYNFAPHPVLYIDFHCLPTDLENFGENFTAYMKVLAQEHGVDASDNKYASQVLCNILRTYSLKKQIVILIDGYDRLFNAYLDQQDKYESVIRELDGFIYKIKVSTSINQCFLTGVTEFSMMALYGANQFINLSFDDEYATLCGYTRAESEHYFGKHISHAQQLTGLGSEQWWKEIDLRCYGYTWNFHDVHDDETHVYRPSALLRYLSNPAELTEHQLHQQTFPLPASLANPNKIFIIDVDTIPVRIEDLLHLNHIFTSTLALLFQTGYLTLKLAERTEHYAVILEIGFPNLEIKKIFYIWILSSIIGSHSIYEISTLPEIIKNENWDQFFALINTVLTCVPHEKFDLKVDYCHAIIYSIIASVYPKITGKFYYGIRTTDITINYTNNKIPKCIVLRLVSSTDPITDDDNSKDQELAYEMAHRDMANYKIQPPKNSTIIGIVINTTVKQITAWTLQ